MHSKTVRTDIELKKRFRSSIYRVAIGVTLCVCSLYGCDESGHSSSSTPISNEEILYAQYFETGNGGWETVLTLSPQEADPNGVRSCSQNVDGSRFCTAAAPIRDGSMELQSPWFLDANHAPPGAGYLSLLAWVYLGGQYGAPTGDVRSIDLRNAKLKLDIKATNLDVKGGHLVFWFQTALPDGRFGNFAYTAAPIETLLQGQEWQQIEVDLSADPTKWTCLGSADFRSRDYGCAPVEDVMGIVSFDFGLIITPVSSSLEETAQPTGVISLQSIELVRDTRRTQ